LFSHSFEILLQYFHNFGIPLSEISINRE
jgi:hypothetical protein